MTILADYLAGIPAPHRAAADAIGAQLSSIAGRVDPAVQSFIFLPNQQDHPVYPDAAKVFDLAGEQILLAETPLTNEIPLLFVGYHGMNRFTRNRQTLGFLLTDQRILIQEKFAAIFARDLPKYRLLPLSASDPAPLSVALVAQVADEFDWASFNDLAEAGYPQPQLSQLLIDSIICIVRGSLGEGLSVGADLGSAVNQPTARDLHLRLAELGLREKVCLPDDPKLVKILKKFGPKLGIEEKESIVFGVVDKTFVGAYGLVVADIAVRSCDLMESPVVSLRADIEPKKVSLNDENTAIVTEAGKAHVLPQYLSEGEKRGIAILIRELESSQ